MDANTFQTLQGAGKRFVIVQSRFNEDITSALFTSAHTLLTSSGVRASDIVHIEVPGVLEIPYVLSCVLSDSFDAAIVLGAVIEGSTPHFDYISRAVTEACVSLSIAHKTPISQGIITCHTKEQAMERSGNGPLNRGREAAHVALEMASIREKHGWL